MNTKFMYLHRTAGNFKTYFSEVLNGEISEQDVAAIKAHLIDGEYFYPASVGLPQPSALDLGDDDPTWFEFEGIELTDTEPTLKYLTAPELVKLFEDGLGCNPFCPDDVAPEPVLVRKADEALELYHNTPVARRAVIDADTVLADVVADAELDEVGLGENALQIFKNAGDKNAVAALFECITGVNFEEFLDRCIRETTKSELVQADEPEPDEKYNREVSLYRKLYHAVNDDNDDNCEAALRHLDPQTAADAHNCCLSLIGHFLKTAQPEDVQKLIDDIPEAKPLIDEYLKSTGKE